MVFTNERVLNFKKMDENPSMKNMIYQKMYKDYIKSQNIISSDKNNET